MERTMIDTITIFLAELMGTGLLVFLGCMGCVSKFLPGDVAHLQITINFGLAVMICIQIFGAVSGSHINPAVSVSAAIYGLISYSLMFVYIGAQFIGGFMGYSLLRLVTPIEIFYSNSTDNGLCVTVPPSSIPVPQALAVEFIITFILILVCCGVWDPRHADHHDSVQLKFGLAITCLAISGAPYSGGSMNPARSFGPALWHMNFTTHWIYWVGPFLAAVTATYFYKYVFWRDVPKQIETERSKSSEMSPLRA